MSMIVDVQADLLSARKQKNEPVKNLLTALVGEAVMIGKNNGNRETTDEEVVALVKKFVKNAEETKLALEKDNRSSNEAAAEIHFLQKYIPRQFTETEVSQLLIRYKTHNKEANMGDAMKYLKEQFSGQYDGRTASRVAKEIFQ